MRSQKTWIVIADAGRARILERHAGGRLSELPDSRIEQHVPSSREIVSDKQGTTMVSGGAERHAYSPRHDPHREAKRHFIERLAAQLDAHVANGDVDRIVLVAPPQALGDLRAALSDAAVKRVIGEVHKDLTKTPDHEIDSHLGDVIL